MPKKQLSDAFKNSKGQLHRELGVKAGEKISKKKLEAAVKAGGLEAKRARPVLNMERARAKSR